MDFRFSPEDEAFRAELRRFFEDEIPPDWVGGSRNPDNEDWDLTLSLRGKMSQKGWLTMHWPKEYGGQDAGQIQSTILTEELTYHRCPGRDIFAVKMLSPTLMIHGTEDQKQEFLPPIAKGEVQWCQGYSEPESGIGLGFTPGLGQVRRGRLRHQRQQDMDLHGPQGGPHFHAGQDRPGRSRNTGDQLHSGGHEHARHHGQAHTQHDGHP